MDVVFHILGILERTKHPSEVVRPYRLSLRFTLDSTGFWESLTIRSNVTQNFFTPEKTSAAWKMNTASYLYENEPKQLRSDGKQTAKIHSVVRCIALTPLDSIDENILPNARNKISGDRREFYRGDWVELNTSHSLSRPPESEN